MKALTYIEIDIPSFVEASPEEIVTYRFTYDCDYLPADIEAIPSLVSVGFTPAVLSLGKDMGTRASLSASMHDHKHIFNGESFDSGTFWGKFRARYGTRLQGYSLRWIQGVVGQTLAEMETRHFVIESTNGPTPSGAYTFVAKDVLKFADGDRAQAPYPNNGFMVGAIDDNDLAFTLSPAGVGDEEYAASGHIALGGEEIVSFTRSGDNITIVARGQLGTTAVSHDAGSRVQTVLRYVGEDPAVIIHDLLTTYAGVNPDYIPLTTWENETDAFLQQNYSANIAEPTAVSKLINELIETAALVLWWEPLTEQIRLQVLRPVSAEAAVFDEDNTLEGSLSVTEQPGTRVSQVFVYFGQRNPLQPIDEEQNFRSAVLTIDSEAELAYAVPMIKKVYSRWIPFGARTVAVRLSNLILGRFRDPPRRFAFNLFRHGDEDPQLGGGYRLASWVMQNEDGTPTNAPIQITKLNPMSDRYEIQAEELFFDQIDPADLVNRVIIIDSAINNINLRELHDAIYPDPDASASPAESVRFIIEANVIVGSNEANQIACTVGDWPVGYPVTLEVFGHIRGAGGDGGPGLDNVDTSGEDGGTALYTRFPIDLTLYAEGTIWGGGGGGNGLWAEGDDSETGLGGGGGAGVIAGDGGQGQDASGFPGTAEEGGAGANEIIKRSGDGGDPGQPGGYEIVPGSFVQDGGDGGPAIDGISFITLDDQTGSPSSIVGAEIN